MEREYDKKKEVIALAYAAVIMLGAPLYNLCCAQDIVGCWNHLVYLLTTISFYALLTSIFKRRHLLWILTPMLLLNLVDLVPVVAYGCTPSLMFTYSLLVAEGGETMELLGTYLPLILLILTFWSVYFLLNFRYVQKAFFYGKKTRLITGIISSVWLLVSGIGATVYALSDNAPAFKTVLNVCPFNELYNVQRVALIRHNVRMNQAELPSAKIDAQSSAQDDELVVLLIGETGRYRNWQINGYGRETSPRMMERKEQLISMDSCYTVANLTTVSVPLLLSSAKPNDLEHYYENPSVVRAFRGGGYKTAWIADQSFDNPFLLTISGQCDYIFYHDHHSFSFYDIDLLSPLRECLSLPGKQLVVLHTLGCHFKYSARYPEEMRFFKPDLYDVSWNELRSLRDFCGISFDRRHPQSSVANIVRSILTNSYDNALRYTDSFLDSVLVTLEETGRPVSLLYVADHGENLLDDEEHLFLHGQGKGTIYEYHVPCFVWASEAYKERYPERWKTMQRNHSKQISTMSVFHTLLDLGGVSLSSYEPEMSFASPHLRPETIAYKLDGNLRLMPFSVSEPPIDSSSDE